MNTAILDVIEQMKPTVTTHQEGICPTCHRHSHFEFAGVQTWPERVAKLTGIREVRLWTCEHCLSTISETNLT